MSVDSTEKRQVEPQYTGYPSVDLPAQIDSLPDTDPVHMFVSRVRRSIKDQVPALHHRDMHLPGKQSLASSAPDLNNDHLSEELLPFADDLPEALDLTRLTLLEDFHQTRLTWLSLGRSRQEATDLALTGVTNAIAQKVEDPDELLNQTALIRKFAVCYGYSTA